jgi:hypothetical protein
MAKFFPESFPFDADPRDPEYQLFRMLHELPEHFSVIYSKKFKGGKYSKEETEIDFLIFDGHKNLICLEVKGGEIAYSGPDRQWFQNGKEMKKAPDWQASAATKAVIEYLGPDSLKLNIGWALAFPDCSRPAGSGRIAEVPDDLILDSQVLLDPEKAIARVCHYNESHFCREGVNRYQASSILERLLRSVGFITKIGVALLHDAKQLVQATEQQLDILDDLELNPKTAVMGYAGTGKTIIATEFAKRCSEKGQKVLLLFYNRMVANTVRYGLGRDSSIECSTFHSLARNKIESIDKNWWDENKSANNPDFWDMAVPLKMLELLESKNPQYNVIIVDEGQDFKPEWFETLEKLLIPDEASRYVVFYDGNQDIFGRWKSLPWQPHAYTKKNLRKNCRNTKAIINYLNKIIPSEMVGFENSPAGQPVRFENSSSLKEESIRIRDCVESFLKEGVEPGKIVILINKSLAESSVSAIQKIGRYPVEWMGKTYRPDAPLIQVTNITNFKGLEADVILVTGIGKQEHTKVPEMLYTQASRARLLLSIYLTDTDRS